MICLLIRAELDGLICSGPKQGKQFTYMLLDERVPVSISFNKDEALAELTKRYFNSHGPATIKDFAWWSGLAIADAKKGVELIKSHLVNEKVKDETFWFSSAIPIIKKTKSNILLLPAFDEYMVAYKNRPILIHPSSASRSSLEILNPVIVQKGRIIGTWKRTVDKNNVTIKPNLFISLSPSALKSLQPAAKAYAKFIGKKINL
ncbi:MAG TPA: crosslink repair DNA glycosylase YcaQ family protein [Chitinophagaceae bacterium]|nr:crosslink repair DNA glycosylase YcaQ family protein [Chitinophagaceae bacterium]